jgi:hypothetical protein
MGPEFVGRPRTLQSFLERFLAPPARRAHQLLNSAAEHYLLIDFSNGVKSY